MPSPVRLSTGRLLLRPWEPTDVTALVRLCADPEIARWTTMPARYSAEDARRFLARSAEGWEQGTAAAWAVTDAASGAVLASVSLHDLDAAYPMLGFWCAADRRGHGVVGRAAHEACAWALARGVPKVGWLAEIGNEPSWRVAYRLGFAYEGRQAVEIPHADGTRADAWAAALLPGALCEDRPLPFGPDPDLHDGEVGVRPFRADDVDDWLAGRNEPDVIARGYGGARRRALTRDEARAELLVDAVQQRMTGAGRELAITVEGRVVGSISFHRVGGDASLGWWVGGAGRGRGAAGRALRMLVAELADAGFVRAEARIHVDNVGSRRTAERAGLRQEGTLARNAPWDGDELGDAALYGVVLAATDPSAPASPSARSRSTPYS